MRRQSVAFLAGAFACGLLANGAAFADSTVSYTASYGQKPTDWGGETAGNVYLQQFNPNLGTLTGMNITASFDISGSATVFASNDSPVDATDMIINSKVLLLDPTQPIDLSGANNACDLTAGNFNCIPLTGVDAVAAEVFNTNITSPTTFNYSGITATSTDTLSLENGDGPFVATTTVYPSYLSYFTGTGTVDVPAVTEVDLQGHFDGNAPLSQTTNATVTATVTYTYTPASSPIPEPADIAVFGIALAGLGFVRRKLKQR